MTTRIQPKTIFNPAAMAMVVTLFWSGSAETKVGTIAFIDINDAQGVPSVPDTNGNYWNSTATATDTVALIDTSNVSTGWTLDTQVEMLGCHPQGRWLEGDVAEIMLYRTALTTVELGQVHRYAAEKYGLSLTPPQ